MLQINLLPWRNQYLKLRRKKYLLTIGWLISSFLIIIIFAEKQQRLAINLLNHQVTEINNTQKNQHTQLKALQQQQRHYDQLQLLSVSQHQQRLKIQQHLELLKSLPQLLPPNSWLDKLSHQDNQLELNINSYLLNEIMTLITDFQHSRLLTHLYPHQMKRSTLAINQLSLKAYWQGIEDADIQ